MPEELHRDRPGRQAAKRRATPTIHRQSSAAWMGTRISVSVAVVPCICRQKELAGRVIPSFGNATSDIRMPDAMHSVMDSSSSRLTSQTNRSRPPPLNSFLVVDHPVPVQREVDKQDHAKPDAEPFVRGDPGESKAVGE